MHQKQTLQRRIITSFFLLTLVLGGGFAAVVYFVVHELETELFYEHLDQDAAWLINADNSGTLPSLPHDIQLYKTHSGDLSGLPDYLHTLTRDRSEVILDNKAYHVIVKTQGNQRFYLVQDQSRFEKMEQAIALGIMLAYIGALAGALWLGSITARRVLSPVIQLATRVDDLSLMATEKKGILSQQYSDDEVGQLARAFETYRQKLQGFLDREKLFTGDVSHELRTPLMVITSSCELLLSKPESDDNSQRVVNNIYTAAQEMQLLVDVFLMLSRNKEGSIRQSSTFLCNTIIEEEIEQLTSLTTENKQIKIHLNDETQLKLQGIPQLFRVVIRNLLQNAYHYTRQGHISVHIETTTVRVEDTGPGIPEQLKASIFEKSSQAPSNYSGQGQGLGLSIIQRICDYQNWGITLQPVASVGSCFTMDFSSSITPET